MFLFFMKLTLRLFRTDDGETVRQTLCVAAAAMTTGPYQRPGIDSKLRIASRDART